MALKVSRNPSSRTARSGADTARAAAVSPPRTLMAGPPVALTDIPGAARRDAAPGDRPWDVPSSYDLPVAVRAADVPFVACAINSALRWDEDPFRRLADEPEAPPKTHEMISISTEAIRTHGEELGPVTKLRRTGTAAQTWLALCYRADRLGSGGKAKQFVPVALAPMVGMRARYSDDPAYKEAAQRIRTDIRRLEKQRLLTIDATGDRWDVTMLRTDGSGRPWKRESDGLYIRVPVGLVRHGWLAVLPTRAVFATLVLLDEWARQNQRWPVETTHPGLRRRYGISPDMFRDGVNDLKVWGLATYDGRKLRSLGGGPTDYRTMSAWTLDVDLFQTHSPLGRIPPRLWPKLTRAPSTARAAAHRLDSEDARKLTARTARTAMRFGEQLRERAQAEVL